MNNIASILDRPSHVTRKSVNTNNDSVDTSSEARVYGQPQELVEKRDSMTQDTLPAFRLRRCTNSPCTVTLSPQAVAQLQARYIGLQQTGSLKRDITFEQFLSVFLSKRRGENYVGLGDGKTTLGSSTDAQLIDKPPRQLRGVVHTLVLLVDFSDKPHDGNHVTSYYDTMLLSEGTFPTGSMRDYYKKISGFTTLENPGIDIQGKVYGWFRMPQPLSYYAGRNSGLGTFPNNAQGLAGTW
jgi:immune inhibitor A